MFGAGRALLPSAAQFGRSVHALTVKMEGARMREHVLDIFNSSYRAVLPQVRSFVCIFETEPEIIVHFLELLARLCLFVIFQSC